ncbi:MAG: TRAP transporter substrate-binding protein DctP [Desulfatibacillaceae bacterium]
MRVNKGIFAAAALLASLCMPASVAFAQDSEPRYMWKTATLAPKGLGWSLLVQEQIFPLVEEATNGELRLKVYWSGVLGNDSDYIRLMRAGRLQSAGLTALGSAEACPEFMVLQLPFLFRNYDELDHVRNQTFDMFDQRMQQHGFKLLLWIDQDFDQLYSTKWELKDLSQFEQATFATWNGAIERMFLEQTGAKTVDLEIPEISDSMRRDRVDSLMGPAIWMVGTQLHSVLRYVNVMKTRYSPATIVTSMDAWNELPEQYRRNMVDRREEVTADFTAGTRKESEKALAAMLEYGVQKVEMNPLSLARFHERTRAVWDIAAGDLFPRPFLDRITGILEEYRKTETER